jgi:hypothetical protein
MSETDGVRFVDLPADTYPVTVVMVEPGTDNIVFKTTARGPGVLEYPVFDYPADVFVYGSLTSVHNTTEERAARIRRLVREAGDV